MRIIGRVLKFLLGLLFLPLCAPLTLAFYRGFGRIQTIFGYQLYFIIGVIIYAGMHLFIFKPNYLYILGHEMVHALATFLCGGRVTSFHISREGGSVNTTKSNFFISITPYIIPIYSLLLCFVFFLLSSAYDTSHHTQYFVFFLSFTLTMHIVMTFDTLKVRQPDLARAGYLFSFVVIYVTNIFLIAFVLSRIFPEYDFPMFCRSFWLDSKDLYISLFHQIFG